MGTSRVKPRVVGRPTGNALAVGRSVDGSYRVERRQWVGSEVRLLSFTWWRLKRSATGR